MIIQNYDFEAIKWIKLKKCLQLSYSSFDSKLIQDYSKYDSNEKKLKDQ